MSARIRTNRAARWPQQPASHRAPQGCWGHSIRGRLNLAGPQGDSKSSFLSYISRNTVFSRNPTRLLKTLVLLLPGLDFHPERILRLTGKGPRVSGPFRFPWPVLKWRLANFGQYPPFHGSACPRRASDADRDGATGSPYNGVLRNLPLRFAQPVEFPPEGSFSCLPQPLTFSTFRRAGVTLF